MPDIKVRRIEKNLQYVLSNIVFKLGPSIEKNIFVSVTKVMASPDLDLAKVYVNFLNHKQTKEILLAKLESKELYIKKLLGQSLGKHMRKTPRLRFFLDNTYKYIEDEVALFKKLKNK